MPSISVASYNILADAYLRPHWFEHCDPGHLDPAWRLPALVGRVEGLDADVVCLQESEPAAYEALALRLRALGYSGHYARKGGDRPDGCATFFRSPPLTLRSTRTLYYADGLDGAADSGHLALLLELECEGWPMILANTHIRWDAPERSGTDHIGVRQVRELLARTRSRHPLVVCGDLNATAHSEVVGELLRSGLLDAYAGQDAAYTCNANADRKRIDFILHGEVFTSTPTPLTPIDNDTPLPSEQEPSDHLPISAALVWS